MSNNNKKDYLFLYYVYSLIPLSITISLIINCNVENKYKYHYCNHACNIHFSQTGKILEDKCYCYSKDSNHVIKELPEEFSFEKVFKSF